MLHRLKLLTVPILLALGARTAQAQCYLPDGLDGGPCCGIASAQVPYLPNFTQGTQSICWNNCGIDQVTVVKGRWKGINIAPGTVPPNCGEQRMRLDILNGANTLMWRGNLRLIYSRTWVAVDTNGLAFQVWRFLVNGDMRNYPAAGPAPCPVPPCALAFGNNTRFTGYLDYTEDCSVPNGNPQFAWMLTHACDALDHHAGFPRSGAYHPGRSYSFVSPDAGFIPGPIQPTEGTPGSGFDSIRQRVKTTAPTTVLCTHEEPVTHSLFPQQQLCVCGTPGSNQWMIGDLTAQGPCGSGVRTPIVGPLLPGYMSMGLGAWTNPNAYPGQQVLRWNIAGYDVGDVCTGNSQHLVYYGVTTIGGYQAFDLVAGNPGNILPPTFIDQASSQVNNGNPTMNRPYTSYHIITLNH